MYPEQGLGGGVVGGGQAGGWYPLEEEGVALWGQGGWVVVGGGGQAGG